MTDQQRLVYTVGEVAELLRVGKNRVYEMVAAGRIPAIKWSDQAIGIPRQSLEQYLVEEAARQQQERQGPSELATPLARTALKSMRRNRARTAS